MQQWRARYLEAVQAHGVAAVARVTGIPRVTILSVCSNVARKGSDLLASERVDRLDALDRPEHAR